MFERATTGNAIIEIAVTRLNTQLDVIETRVVQSAYTIRIHAHTGSNEIGVVAEPPSFFDQHFQIAPDERLAAGKSQLRRSEGTRFP